MANNPNGYYDPATGAFVPFAAPKKKKSLTWLYILIVAALALMITKCAADYAKENGYVDEPAETEAEAPQTEAEPAEMVEASAVPDEPEPLVESDYLEMVAEAIDGKIGSGEKITGITLENRTLTVYVDLSESTAEAPVDLPVEMLAEARASSITDGILTLSDELWDTVVVDFGDVGISTSKKSDIVITQYGRYFDGINIEVEP